MTWRIDRNAVAVREARGSSILSRRLRCREGTDILKDGDGAASTITQPFALRPTNS